MPTLGVRELLVFIPNLGPMELVIILLIVLVIFGSSKLPQLGKGLGEGIKNFKKGIKDRESDSLSEDASSDDSN